LTWIGINYNGPGECAIFPEGTRMNSEVILSFSSDFQWFINVIDEHIEPYFRRRFPANEGWLQQDSVPWHTSRESMARLEEQVTNDPFTHDC